MTPRDALESLFAGNDLTHGQMTAVMTDIMTGVTTPLQTAALVTALRYKGESVTELAAAVQVMRSLSAKVDTMGLQHVVDTCGTGGDGMHTFNISTTAAFVAAAAGACVAKHGGRSVSSSSGSADVLETLGIGLHSTTPERAQESLQRWGLGFMFAPHHHSAMKYAVGVRRELGVRTLFNLLGPMTNPAGAPNQLLGVFAAHFTRRLAEVLRCLGTRHALVVHGSDGLDEITLSGPTHMAELRDGEVREFLFSPNEVGIQTAPLNGLLVKDAMESRQLLLSVLDNQPGPARDIVLLNAGAALYVSGISRSLGDGVERARETLAAGAARQRLQDIVGWSQA
ncbi:MAG: anthranilate phosphoribosyltransferase [Ferrovum sp.]|nr:anthranilate phosphoribosyltransferase [Ferrovum sp.]NDU86684.1 anthranilate phosphoribosyltransferase [Ferrovum sp.]